MPRRDCLIVLNYHRIGDPSETVGDPGVFSASAEEFGRQVAFLRARYLPVGLDEAVRFVEGRADGRAARVLVTFDDGYIDNYRLAYPILKTQGVPGDVLRYIIVRRQLRTAVVGWTRLRSAKHDEVAACFDVSAPADYRSRDRL